MRARRAATAVVVVFAAAIAAACGSSGGDGGRGDPSADPSAADAALVDHCDDVAPVGPVREGNLPAGANIDDNVALGAIHRYTAEHPDTFAGEWIDRASGGTYVVAFTDDPGPHLEAILALRAAPGDPQGIVPPDPVTDDTTVGEAGFVVDVVQVEHTAAELEAAQEATMPVAAELGIFSAGRNPTLNRVTVSVEVADEEVRRSLAEVADPSMLCVEGPTEPVVVDADTPVTLLPPAGGDPLVSCDSIAFPVSALDGPTGVEAGDDPMAQALREVLSSMGAELGAPGAGWRLLAEDDGQALLASGEPPDMATVMLEQEGDRWTFAGASSGCRPRPVLPDGIGSASWDLDPAHPPAPGDREVHVLVTEAACTGSQPVGDRLVGPEVRETDDEVVIAVAVRSLGPGSYTCPSNPALPVTVELAAPLGDRTLLDGGVVPPRPPGDGPT